MTTRAYHNHHHHHRRRHHHYIVRRLIAILVVTTTTSVVFTTHSFQHASLTSCRRPHASCIYKKPLGSFGNDATTKCALVSIHDDDDEHGGVNPRYRRLFALAAVNQDVDDSDEKTSTKSKLLGRKQGVYTRPSAAIERGSGFFVPGLEGAKVRLAVGTVLLFLAAVNHFLSSSSSTVNAVTGNILAEGLAVTYSLLVLVQAAIEYTKDDLILKNAGPAGNSPGGSSSVKKSAAANAYQQQWSIPVDENDGWKDKVEWSAQTYLSLTPATNVILIGPGKVIYRLGQEANNHGQDDDDNNHNDQEEESEACELALQLLSKSTSGRLSLPASHPIAMALVPKRRHGEATRSVVLQRISTTRQSNNNNLAFLVSSNQLLASFTPQDLTWLGQLARALSVNNPIA